MKKPKKHSQKKQFLNVLNIISIIVILIIALFMSNNNWRTTTTSKAQSLPTRPIVVDHNSVALFDRIPDQYLQAAANLHMIFMDRSVGVNINEGLSCLTYPSNDSRTPNHCKRYTHTNPQYSVNPTELQWTKSYNRSNWDYGNFYDTWQNMTTNYINLMDNGTYPGNYDVYSFQFSYLNVTDDNTIANNPGGFFSRNTGDKNDVYDLETRISRYPGKTFIYMTSSLARTVGSRTSTQFNQQMRQFTLANNKVLFDIADIESHDPYGQACYDNQSGIYPAICPHYTTETAGGHLGSVSAGKIRIAKAFWVLMAQIAGWNPNNTSSTSLPTPTITQRPNTPTPTRAIATNTPRPSTPTPTRTTITNTPTPRPSTLTPTSTSTTAYSHIANLDKEVRIINENEWQPRFRIYVHDNNHKPISNAQVTATLTYGGNSYTTSCNQPTNASGFCNIVVSRILNTINQVTLQIVNINSTGKTYRSSENHDANGDSNGTSITLNR